MSFFTSFTAAFCGACVFIGALYMLCPDGVMSKPLKYILGLIFILTVISAAAIAVGKWDFESIDFTASAIDTESLDTANAEYVYAYALTEAGIDFSKITVCTDKTETGSISISKVIICSDCEETRILEALGEAAENTEVEIVND